MAKKQLEYIARDLDGVMSKLSNAEQAFDSAMMGTYYALEAINKDAAVALATWTKEVDDLGQSVLGFSMSYNPDNRLEVNVMFDNEVRMKFAFPQVEPFPT
jgi:hypothetical protein